MTCIFFQKKEQIFLYTCKTRFIVDKMLIILKRKHSTLGSQSPTMQENFGTSRSPSCRKCNTKTWWCEGNKQYINTSKLSKEEDNMISEHLTRHIIHSTSTMLIGKPTYGAKIGEHFGTLPDMHTNLNHSLNPPGWPTSKSFASRTIGQSEPNSRSYLQIHLGG